MENRIRVMEAHVVISRYLGGILLSIRSKLYESGIKRGIRMANVNVKQAFGGGQKFPVEKIAIFSVAVLAVMAAFAAISFAVIDRTTVADITPEPVIKSSAKAPVPALFPDFSKLPETDFKFGIPEAVTQFILMVDKARNELFVLEETKNNYKIVKRFNVSLGSQMGDKEIEGDKKTPEGYYKIIRIKEDGELPPKYGPRAFVLNYPNELDVKMGKTGSGIWIHGSGLGQNIEDTEGCVEVSDKNIIELGKFADVDVPVYIFPEKFKTPIRNGAIQKDIFKPDTLYAIKQWWSQKANNSEADTLARVSGSSGS